MFPHPSVRQVVSALAVLASALLAACTVGPAVRAPGLAVPDDWYEHAATDAELARTARAMRDWWNSFHDSELSRLVALTIAGDQDVRAAGADLLSARALRDQIAGGLYPQLDFGTDTGIERFSTTVQNWPLPGYSSDYRLWQYGFTASWDADLFGRIRRSVEAQDYATLATVEQRRALLLSALSELCTEYVALRVTQARLAITDRDIATAAEALRLTDRLYAQGLTTTLATAQARSELETEQATRPPLETRAEQAAHAISVLTGAMPGALEPELLRPAPLPALPPLPVALPSTVVAERPDIREAERRYAQAQARIGVAVAQLYPRFTVPLSFTPQSSMVHELFTAASSVWSLLLQSSVPLYHGGALRAQVRQARAEAEAARIRYDATVLNAFREVEDRLAAFRNDDRRTASLADAVRDSDAALDRARRLYGAGLTGFIDVLEAERSAYSAADLEALSRQAQLVDAVALFTALGAGWQGASLSDTSLPVTEAEQHAMARRHAGT